MDLCSQNTRLIFVYYYTFKLLKQLVQRSIKKKENKLRLSYFIMPKYCTAKYCFGNKNKKLILKSKYMLKMYFEIYFLFLLV